MIDISSSSFDPMIRYTVPVPIPAAEAIGMASGLQYLDPARVGSF